MKGLIKNLTLKSSVIIYLSINKAFANPIGDLPIDIGDIPWKDIVKALMDLFGNIGG